MWVCEYSLSINNFESKVYNMLRYNNGERAILTEHIIRDVRVIGAEHLVIVTEYEIIIVD